MKFLTLSLRITAALGAVSLGLSSSFAVEMEEDVAQGGLLRAVNRGLYTEVSQLQEWLDRGADPSQPEVIERAVEFGQKPEVIEFLVAQGADPNAIFDQPSPFYSPLSKAAFYSTLHGPTVVEALLAHGANPNLVRIEIAPRSERDLDATTESRKAHCYSPLMVAIDQALQNNPQTRRGYRAEGARKRRENALAAAKALIDAGANVDYQTDSGVSPLMIAAQSQDIEIVRFLLDHGADPTLEDAIGRNARTYANDSGGQREVVRLLPL